MTLTEILLILAVIVVLITPHFLLKKIKQPTRTYIKLLAGLVLLILVWFSAPESSLPIKVLMSAIVVSSAIKTIKDYLDHSSNAKIEQP